MDADSYTIMRALTALDMTPSQKLVGFILALHFHRPSQSVRVRRETICEETGLSLRTVKTALQALRDGGYFESCRTGRASVYRVGSRVVKWMVQNLPHQMVQNLPHQEETFEAICEAKYKAELQRERQEKQHSYPSPRRRRR